MTPPQDNTTIEKEASIVAIDEIRDEVNMALGLFFEERIAHAATIDSSYQELYQAIKDLIMAGGKRFRPYLTVLAYEACGGSHRSRILPVAISQELLHASLLVTDDIIDRDYVRYGRDNVAAVMLKRYQRLAAKPGEAQHLSDSAAILAGNILMSEAHTWLARSDFSHQAKVMAHQIFNLSIIETAAGEQMDYESALHDPHSVDSLKIARYKTAGYSLMGPLSIGATLAGADKDTIQDLCVIGSKLGVAYQLHDDFLGMFGDEEQLGKPAVSDAEEGKRTYLLKLMYQMCSEDDRKILDAIVGTRGVTAAQLESVRQIARKCGARKAVEDLIRQNEHDCIALIAQLHIPVMYQNTFAELVLTMLRRTY